MAADRYHGKAAIRYEAERRKQAKWRFETRTVIKVLSKLNGEIDSIIDAPVGTGRFLELYKIPVVGLDISKDMLRKAAGKLTDAKLYQHDLVNKPITARADLVISIRFLNLMSWREASKALINLLAASNKYILFTMRTVPDGFKGKMNVGRVYLHREFALLGLLTDNSFLVVKRYHFEDKVPGSYDLVLCRRVDG